MPLKALIVSVRLDRDSGIAGERLRSRTMQ